MKERVLSHLLNAEPEIASTEKVHDCSQVALPIVLGKALYAYCAQLDMG